MFINPKGDRILSMAAEVGAITYQMVNRLELLNS
jgi:hypothetical protein